MKTAILLAGPMRSLPEVIANHKQMVGDYDTFVSCRQEDYNDWINSDWNPKEIYITPEIDFETSNWGMMCDVSDKSFRLLLTRLQWQFHNLSNCIKNMPKGYDYYIKSRNDMVYEYPLDINFESIKEDEIWCPEKTFWGYEWINNGFFNDQLWICKENVLELAGKFVTDGVLLNNSIGDEIRKGLLKHSIIETSFILWLANWDIKQKKFTYPYTKNHFGWTKGNYDRENWQENNK